MREYIIQETQTDKGRFFLPEDAIFLSAAPYVVDHAIYDFWTITYAVPVYEQPDTGHPSDLFETPEYSLLEHAYRRDDIKRRIEDITVIGEERDLSGVPITFIEEAGF